MPEVNPYELFANWKMKVLLYGRSGLGKTYLAATAALVQELSPVWFYTTEFGILSIKHIILKTQRIQPVVAQGVDDLMQLKRMIVDPGKYKCIVVDSLTELYAQLMAQHLQRAKQTVPRRQDYRDVHDTMLKFLRYMERKTAVHFIVTAGDTYDKDERGKVLNIDPDVVGKLAYRAPRYFDIVGYMQARADVPIGDSSQTTITRWIQVQPYGGTTAKDRSPEGSLGAKVMQPTMAKIYQALIGPCVELPMSPVENPDLQLTFTRPPRMGAPVSTGSPKAPQDPSPPVGSSREAFEAELDSLDETESSEFLSDDS